MSGNYVNYATANNTDALNTVLERLRLNTLGNQMVDDVALLKTGISVDTVVKYSSANNQWEACDGTVVLTATDVIGIVTYVDGTTDTIGQVKVGGVYVKSGLAVDTDYYCQSDGSINTTKTKVLLGKCCAAGQLVLKINGGGGGGGDVVGPASATDGAIALFDETTGKLLKDSTLTIPVAVATYAQPIPTSSSFGVGTLAFLQYSATSELADNATTSGSNLMQVYINSSNGVVSVGSGGQTGTWKNISGRALDGDGTYRGGYFVRTV